MHTTPESRIQNHLISLYGSEEAVRLWGQIASALDDFSIHNPTLQRNNSSDTFSEQDVILITYGDQFKEESKPPLQSLERFLNTYLLDTFSSVHILPFYPYSSDDGFSVIDYLKVDPNLGDWEDVEKLGENFKLMFDAVINHISQESDWFKNFRNGEEPYRNYFITVDPATDLSQVVRPRALPLLTAIQTVEGERYIWTTFSEDQIDLNFANPQVLFEIIQVLLFYVAKGAEIIRLDAIAYLWKEPGTTSIHLPQTHQVVKLFRAVLDAVTPWVVLITETNVPHKENMSYFGDLLQDSQWTDEAQMVYQFPLAPLVLHTFHTSSSQVLTQWAAGLETPSTQTFFFNFIASHDGIGVRPAEGLLNRAELQALAERTIKHGGQVSYRYNPDGSKSPYELNITLYDALNDPQNPSPQLDLRRFIASQAILLSLAGVPGIYVHSLFGSRNCHSCLAESGRARSINREKFQLEALEARLADPQSHEGQVYQSYIHLLSQRRQKAAFHPNAAQRLLNLKKSFFGLVRTAEEGNESIICLVNLSNDHQQIELDLRAHDLPSIKKWQDLIGEEDYLAKAGKLVMVFKGCQAMWLYPVE